jgi:hypothetical protein
MCYHACRPQSDHAEGSDLAKRVFIAGPVRSEPHGREGERERGRGRGRGREREKREERERERERERRAGA